MGDNASMMELIAGYDAYASAAELNTQAAVDAPATTPVCAAVTGAAAGKWLISAAVSAAGGATYKVGC